jgi:hypothetical protein
MKQHLLSPSLSNFLHALTMSFLHTLVMSADTHHISLTLTKATVLTFNWNAATGKLLSIVLSSIDTKWEVWDKVCFAGCRFRAFLLAWLYNQNLLL